MEKEKKGGSSRYGKALSPTAATSPTLNLMEQLLLAKMERQTLEERADEADGTSGGTVGTPGNARRSLSLRRTDSMDSQTSASTYNSLLSTDSTASSTSGRYCKCDDCLLGIVDKYQRSPPTIGRKKEKAILRDSKTRRALR
ncbi:hypothetical protein KM043_001694 [Ampulex compressa]|nr:hypothetical protein KM043_001694 [Ampulex compressa]